MGFLDSLLGKTKLPEAKTDKLFAISTAAITLEASLGYRPDGAAGICIKPMESSHYETVRREIEELLGMSMKETGTEYRLQKDEYNYLWVVLSDPDLDDLVNAIQMVAQILTEQGFGIQILAAVFRFRGEAVIYWIYNFKQGAYYPFVPQSGRQRDTAREFRLKALLQKEMPPEKAESRWYPMWAMPL